VDFCTSGSLKYSQDSIAEGVCAREYGNEGDYEQKRGTRVRMERAKLHSIPSSGPRGGIMSTRWIWAVACTLVLAVGLAQAQSTKLSAGDKSFLKIAAESNMTEAHLGQMAETQAYEATVKTLGKTLDQDHTQAYEALQGVAMKTGQTIPTGIDVARDPAVKQLMRLKGTAFDRDFLHHEIQDHQKAIAQFKQEAEHGENPDIKAYADKTLPSLENHLRQVEALAKPAKKA
jgi:putative membrane protein